MEQAILQDRKQAFSKAAQAALDMKQKAISEYAGDEIKDEGTSFQQWVIMNVSRIAGLPFLSGTNPLDLYSILHSALLTTNTNRLKPPTPPS
jgi:hypothetical protein